MQIRWLRQNQSSQCLLFFGGWGMDPAPFQEVPSSGHDLVMVYDYRELAPFDWTPFVSYEQVHLIGWSMGVWVAAHLLKKHQARFASLTALGGTLSPIDDKKGIPAPSYGAMLAGFNAEVLAQFYGNMFDDKEQLTRFLAHKPQRTLEELGQEMAAFQQAFNQFGKEKDIYTRKIITSRDRIFSGRNQMRSWGKGKGLVRNWPHFPFFLINDWAELLTD